MHNPLLADVDILFGRNLEATGFLKYANTARKLLGDIPLSHGGSSKLDDGGAGGNLSGKSDGSDRATPQHSSGGNSQQLPPGLKLPDHEAVMVPGSDDPLTLDEFMQLREAMNIRQIEKDADRQWRERSIEEIGLWNYMIHGSGDAFHKVSNFFAGWGDTLSGGGTERIRQWFGYDDAVDKNSEAYKWGDRVGFVHEQLLNLSGVGGFGMLGGAAGLAEGIAKGDPAAIMAAAEELVKARLASKGGCGNLILKGTQGLEAANLIADAHELYQKGDYEGAARLLTKAGVMIKQMRSCFAAGTPIRTMYGYKVIEEIRKDDWVLSSDENDAAMAPVPKRVLEVFQRQALILHIHFGDQVIRTTAEHPFYVWGRGWIDAGEMEAGDWCKSEDGRWVMLSDKHDTGELDSVYNFSVEV